MTVLPGTLVALFGNTCLVVARTYCDHRDWVVEIDQNTVSMSFRLEVIQRLTVHRQMLEQ